MFAIALKNIKNSFKSYRQIYILLILSQFVAVIILFFSYGTVTGYDMKKDERLKKERLFYTYFTEPVSASAIKDILPDLLSKMEDRISYVFTRVRNPGSDWEITCIMEYHNGRYGMPLKYYTDDRIICGRYPDEEEMNDGSRVGFVYWDTRSSDKNDEVYELGDKFNLYGEGYEIVGMIDGDLKRITIPFNSCTDDMKIDMFTISFNGFPAADDYELYRETILNKFGSSPQIQEYNPVDMEDIIAYNTVIIMGIAIGVITALDTILVYNYLMKKRQKQMAIFGITGASRLQQILTCETEVLLITLVTTIGGFAVFKLVIEDVLLNVYEIGLPIFNSRVYAIMIGVYTGCILLGTSVVVIINTGKKLLDMRRC